MDMSFSNKSPVEQSLKHSVKHPTSEMNEETAFLSSYELHEHSYFNSKEIPHFVLKLYRILEADKYTEYIRWSDSGDSFIIPDGPLLAAVVLPSFYKSSTFTSFVRQLNIYGFRRITDARKAKNPPSQLASAFAHPSFSRGRVSRLHLIKRKVKRSFRSKSRDVPEPAKESLAPVSNSNLDCSSSDAESLHEIDHSESCTKCHNLREELQLLRNLLRRYQHMEVSGTHQSMPYAIPMEYTNPMNCVRSTEYPMFCSESNHLRLPNWSSEIPIQENTGYEVNVSSELPAFFCPENPAHGYESTITSSHWNPPTNPIPQPESEYTDNIPTLSAALGWDLYAKTDSRESKQFNAQLSC